MPRQNNRKPALILSTVGTSLLTNQLEKDEIRKTIFQTANTAKADLSPTQKNILDTHLDRRRTQLLSAPDQDIKKLSAEMNALLTWQKQNPSSADGAPDHYIFLPSDTYQGQNTARMLVDLVRARGQNADLLQSPGLVTDNLDNFRLALSDLTRKIYGEIKPWGDNGYNIIFNLTGGFKGVNAFLQSLGALVADEIIYIFERSSHLLTLPRLPIQLNAEQLIQTNLAMFHKMSLGCEIPVTDTKEIPDTLLFTLDGKSILSEWGELIWYQAKDSLYRQQLMPAMTAYFHYDAQFVKQARALPPDRLKTLNQRLDDLFCYFRGQQRHCPKSLNFHAIQASRKQPRATHEFYAFSDQDAKRCYGYFDQNNIFHILVLGDHL